MLNSNQTQSPKHLIVTKIIHSRYSRPHCNFTNLSFEFHQLVIFTFVINGENAPAIVQFHARENMMTTSNTKDNFAFLIEIHEKKNKQLMRYDVCNEYIKIKRICFAFVIYGTTGSNFNLVDSNNVKSTSFDDNQIR